MSVIFSQMSVCQAILLIISLLLLTFSVTINIIYWSCCFILCIWYFVYLSLACIYRVIIIASWPPIIRICNHKMWKLNLPMILVTTPPSGPLPTHPRYPGPKGFVHKLGPKNPPHHPMLIPDKQAASIKNIIIIMRWSSPITLPPAPPQTVSRSRREPFFPVTKISLM